MSAAVILSGGSGKRIKSGNIPKQYIKVGGRSVISYVFETVSKCSGITDVAVVALSDWHEELKEEFSKFFKGGEKLCVADPGETRQLSILSGLLALEGKIPDEAIVSVIDAARPNMSKELLSACIDAAKTADGALPVLPMKDTVYLSKDGKKISGLLERKEVFAGQAPEAFKFRKYLDANLSLLPDRIKLINGSSEPAVMAGMDIAVIEGDERNYKITTDEDLIRFKKEKEGDQ